MSRYTTGRAGFGITYSPLKIVTYFSLSTHIINAKIAISQKIFKSYSFKTISFT